MDYADYIKFKVEYFRNPNGFRLGQAFLNKHCPSGESHPDIYYENDWIKANQMILDRFIKWDKQNELY